MNTEETRKRRVDSPPYHVNVPYSSDLAICASGAAEIVRSAWWSVVWTPAHLLPAACVEELLVHWKHESHFVWRRVRGKRVVLLLQDLFELSKLSFHGF